MSSMLLGYPFRNMAFQVFILAIGSDGKTHARVLEKFKDETYLLVGLVPKSQIKESNEATFGSSKWYGIDYQQLVDIVLMPCLENPDLSIYAKPIIQQYVDALRMPYKGKREKLATIEEERTLVRSIYDRFEDVFKAITKYQMRQTVKKETI